MSNPVFVCVCSLISLSAQAHQSEASPTWELTVGGHYSVTGAWGEYHPEYALTVGAEIVIPYQNWELLITPLLEFGVTNLADSWAIIPMPALAIGFVFKQAVLQIGVHTHYEVVEVNEHHEPAFQTLWHATVGWHNDWVSIMGGASLWPTHRHERGIYYAAGPALAVTAEWDWGGFHALGGLGPTIGDEHSRRWTWYLLLGTDVHVW